MTKFKIKQDPTFDLDVLIPRVGGDPIVVPFTFAYKDRDELAKMLDRWADAEKEMRANPDEDQRISDATSVEIEISVLKLKDIVVGWQFDEELSDESLRDLVKTAVTVPASITKAYFEAFNQARLGN